MANGFQKRKEWREELAKSFVDLLEDKGLHWKKEWKGVGTKGQQLPYNAISGRKYNGENVFQLMLASMIRGYNDPRWATFNEIADRQGTNHPGEIWHLKKGSKSVTIGYAFPYDRIDKKSISWTEYHKRIDEGTRDNSDFTLAWKEICLFNASQIEGIKPLELTPEEKKAHEELYNNSISQDELVTKISQSMGVTITNDGGDRAYYSPLADEIHLPDPKVFTSEYAYNATALHELAHATGHESRLNRRMIGSFGSSEYAYEELIAEITSCFTSISISASQTIDDINNHRAYVNGWCQSIKDDPDVLINAISEANKAAELLDHHAGLEINEQTNEKQFVNGIRLENGKPVSDVSIKNTEEAIKEVMHWNNEICFEQKNIGGTDYLVLSCEGSDETLVFKDVDDKIASLSEEEKSTFEKHIEGKNKTINKER